ncbi:hypothetical protein EZS27_020583 [termite gut metagenome]|uniref:Uncharacterized protein n=1 Tax=termite gut metagenome TaxID=433724 RepID=A0A5J4RCC0_9ZZZZ
MRTPKEFTCIEISKYTTLFDSFGVEYYFYLLFLSISESDGFDLNAP